MPYYNPSRTLFLLRIKCTWLKVGTERQRGADRDLGGRCKRSLSRHRAVDWGRIITFWSAPTPLPRPPRARPTLLSPDCQRWRCCCPLGALIASYRAIMTRGALTRWMRGPRKWDRTKRRLLTSLSTSTLKGKHSIKVVFLGLCLFKTS